MSMKTMDKIGMAFVVVAVVVAGVFVATFAPAQPATTDVTTMTSAVAIDTSYASGDTRLQRYGTPASEWAKTLENPVR